MVVVVVVVFQEDLDLSSTSIWCVKLYNWQHSQDHPLENGLRDDSNYLDVFRPLSRYQHFGSCSKKKKKKNALHKDSAQVSIKNVGPVIDGFITAPTV